jgi:rhodanese-related sulfurtransferase
MTEETYAGNKTPQQTWDILAGNPKAQMIDVRTDAEFSYVGGPDLSDLGREALQVYWKIFPAMNTNPDFVAQATRALGPDTGKDTPLLFLCRSGVRSRHAAQAMTAAGWSACYNITSGFEGDKNDAAHRATVNGWKIDGLPWKQG